MEIIEIRPRFHFNSDLSREQIIEEIKVKLGGQNSITAKLGHQQVTLQVMDPDEKFWAPVLTLYLDSEDHKTRITGLYGPKPEVWMLFMFIYLALGLITMFVLIIGLSQYSLGITSYILWLIPFLLGGVLVLYFSNAAGKRLARPKMADLQVFYNNLNV
ncbi:MAG: hypothetical protein KDC49_09600 [Saprospiraceae bacterium]|nr:hypothetical protein [Saprospiraceae bacterium]